jgi:hypothetical protein
MNVFKVTLLSVSILSAVGSVAQAWPFDYCKRFCENVCSGAKYGVRKTKQIFAGVRDHIKRNSSFYLACLFVAICLKFTSMYTSYIDVSYGCKVVMDVYKSDELGAYLDTKLEECMERNSRTYMGSYDAFFNRIVEKSQEEIEELLRQICDIDVFAEEFWKRYYTCKKYF